MDPNLFHADMNRVTEVLLVVILLALMLERALSLVFEHRWFVQKFDQTGIKEVIAFAVSAVVCVLWNFDAISMVILSEKTTLLGELITAGIIAGGSKGSIKLFRDWLGIGSSASKAAAKTRAAKVTL